MFCKFEGNTQGPCGACDINWVHSQHLCLIAEFRAHLCHSTGTCRDLIVTAAISRKSSSAGHPEIGPSAAQKLYQLGILRVPIGYQLGINSMYSSRRALQGCINWVSIATSWLKISSMIDGLAARTQPVTSCSCQLQQESTVVVCVMTNHLLNLAHV